MKERVLAIGLLCVTTTSHAAPAQSTNLSALDSNIASAAVQEHTPLGWFDGVLIGWQTRAYVLDVSSLVTEGKRNLSIWTGAFCNNVEVVSLWAHTTAKADDDTAAEVWTQLAPEMFLGVANYTYPAAPGKLFIELRKGGVPLACSVGVFGSNLISDVFRIVGMVSESCPEEGHCSYSVAVAGADEEAGDDVSYGMSIEEVSQLEIGLGADYLFDGYLTEENDIKSFHPVKMLSLGLGE